MYIQSIEYVYDIRALWLTNYMDKVINSSVENEKKKYPLFCTSVIGFKYLIFCSYSSFVLKEKATFCASHNSIEDFRHS